MSASTAANPARPLIQDRCPFGRTLEHDKKKPMTSASFQIQEPSPTYFTGKSLEMQTQTKASKHIPFLHFSFFFCASIQSIPLLTKLHDTMHLFESASTYRKYYPELSLPRDAAPLIETQHDLFYQPISISRLASEVLHSCKVRSARGEVGTLEDSSPAYEPSLRASGPCFANVKESEKQQTRCNCKHRVASDGSRDRRSSWNDMPKFLLAGALSTVVSRTCVAPLERIKLECIVQASEHTWINIVQGIWISEGLKGFWKGNTLNLFRMVPFKSINFICYDMYIDSLRGGKQGITNRDRLVGGGISGIAATVVCLPLDTIRTRLVAPGGEALGGVAGCFFRMIKDEGFLSLYKGLSPALISMAPANAVFYAVYDILKSCHLSHRKRNDRENEIGVIRTLLYGAIAGACAETVTYPLEVMRRQLQLQQSTNLSLATAFIKLVERDGIGSLFAGLIPSTLQVLPSTALSYLFYEMMKSILKIN